MPLYFSFFLCVIKILIDDCIYYIYGVQCDVLIYVCMRELLTQANISITSSTYHFLVVKMFKIHSLVDFRYTVAVVWVLLSSPNFMLTLSAQHNVTGRWSLMGMFNGLMPLLKGLAGTGSFSFAFLPCDDKVFLLSGGCSNRHHLGSRETRP